MYHSHHFGPCLHCHSQSYIRMVQHLIERCLLLQMSRDQCVKVLAEHASFRPLVTLTVWRELQKENRHFFQAYFHSISPRPLIGSYIQRGGQYLEEGNSTGSDCVVILKHTSESENKLITTQKLASHHFEYPRL